MGRIQQIDNSLDAAAFSTACHGIQSRRKIGSVVNVATLRTGCCSMRKNSKQKSIDRTVNAVAFTTQCRGMHGQLKTRAKDRIVNAATFYLGCRGIGLEAEKKIKEFDFY